MSGQAPQRMRRNASPGSQNLTKQGPMKAVKAFSLVTQSSPTRSNGSSPSFWRLSPDNRSSPERRSPNSPIHKVEKPKAVRGSPASSSLRRTGSWDTIGTPVGQYLTGQWPRDVTSYHSYQNQGVHMSDKATQTTEEWDPTQNNEKNKKKGHRRSASFGHGDQLKIEHIRHKLQRVKEGSKQRQSPVQGNHLAVGLSTFPPPTFTQSKPVIIPSTNIPKTCMSRYQRNSVEGLNTEIEKLVLSSGPEEDADKIQNVSDIPDGRKPPVPDILSRVSSTRSIDTQTPSGCLEDGRSSTDSQSHSINNSPIVPAIPAPTESSPSTNSRSGSSEKEEVEKVAESDRFSESPKVVSSPKPNNSFVREPPDGCEKVFVIEENKKLQPSIKEPLLCRASLKPSHIVLTPSVGSAFCPPFKQLYITTPATDMPPLKSPTSFLTQIEGQ